MIIVDTSIWIDSFRAANPDLALLLAENTVLQHPFVTGELAMGNLRQWRRTVDLLSYLTPALRVTEDALLAFVETNGLAGTGIGFVDAHLLASAVHGKALLWTGDQRLAGHAERLECAWQPEQP
ncbi:type II toxin-antitoxin system VapC family toxin [Novosphingobium sp. CCH12-A3]|uniref:type II toxin-antitoxin system VapC family toxin n=1 Tax=Novosphingobium sp. CCH12-A3 TaxID=1768752 RepID=UPI0007843691|nr:type II toxin-antitoxin system VapC family toxin [Novosphingobium sp. CCH12-A3]